MRIVPDSVFEQVGRGVRFLRELRDALVTLSAPKPLLLALEKCAARSNGSTQPAKTPVLQERTDAIPTGATYCQALRPNPRISMFSIDESRRCEERHIEHS